MARRESIIGQIVADRFRVQSLLGEGGTGQVYLAEHNVLERQFAIKVLRRDLISDQTAAERFRREARAASRMQHRNIVYISDFGSLTDGRLYLVMEYIPGDELSTVIASEKRLPSERAARILLQVAEALDYAHDKGVVHRDLKAENIIITTERHRRDVVKILDFGLAKILFGAGNLDTITFKGQIFGTPEYIPPEQITGDPVDQRADIYAMGVLAFELVTGRTPFTGTLMELLVAHRKLTPPRPTDTCPDANIHPCFDAIVERAMQKNPGDRYQRASDIAAVLRDYLLSTSTEPSSVGDNDLELGRSESPSPRRPPLETAAEAEEPVAPIVGGLPNPMADTLRAQASTSPAFVVDGAALQESASPRQMEAKQQLREQAARVAGLLARLGLASPELRAAMDSSSRLQVELDEAQAELARLEVRLEEAELSGREQESQLRYAVIDLGMAKSRLEQSPSTSSGSKAMLADLQFQVTELERRLLEVARSREAELDGLDSQIAERRRTLEDLKASLLRNDKDFLALLDLHRARFGGPVDLAEPFRVLESLKVLNLS
jgi:serine/threonine protein kinase